MKLALIAAVARNGVVGIDGHLPWHLPEDLQHFKRTTLGGTVIMGRKTWDSLPARFKPLPGRRNLVLTRQPGWQAPGADVFNTLHDALAQLERDAAAEPTSAQGSEPAAALPRVFVIGGAALYAQAMPHADELHLTEIDRDFDGDVRFPAWPHVEFVETWRERHVSADAAALPFSFVTYQRPPHNVHPSEPDRHVG